MAEGEEPPPPGVKAMAAVRWIILGLAVVLALFMWVAYVRERAAPKPASASSMVAPKFHCPMHPQILSDEPGECPICHMDLVPITQTGGGASAASSATNLVILDDAGPATFWCPMHPQVRSAKAETRCPFCKMVLEPIPADIAAQQQQQQQQQQPQDASAATPPPGTAPIELAFDRIQAIGVRTSLVEERVVGSAGGGAGLRVTAIVQPPEAGATEVHVRAPGFVEAIHVDQTGTAVQAGQHLFSIFSPEILQAEQELLTTRSWGNGDAAGNNDAAAAARRKLELLGMTSGEIDQVIAKRAPLRAISVVAPRAGFVMKKNLVLGSRVTPEMTLYEIQDLSRVYVVADVFLRDVLSSAVAVGSEARFVPSNHPNDARTGKIDLIYPVVAAEARTRRIRMQIENTKAASFTPGEFGTIELLGGDPKKQAGPATATTTKKALTIPRDALIDTGSSTYVFVAGAEGRFTPRSVVVLPSSAGVDDDNRVLIEQGGGLAAGERVVSGATFLIDSESRLRASVNASSSTSSSADAGTAHPHNNK